MGTKIPVNCSAAQWITLDEIVIIQGNLKELTEKNYERLKASILKHGIISPWHLWQNPETKKYECLDGTQRTNTLKKMRSSGYEVPQLPVTMISAKDKKEAAEILLSLVSQYGTMSDQGLYEFATEFNFNIDDLDQFNFPGIDLDDFAREFSETDSKTEPSSLSDRFIVPPFSVLDSRQGYWQKRKKEWLDKTGNLSATKENVLTNNQDTLLSQINQGSSNFDPVLAEIMYKWFSVPNGHILDPFGGEQTKGVVAGALGYKYTAVEFRKEQVEVNQKATAEYAEVKYVCGDSNNLTKLVPAIDYDMCLTSPPYYDLEVYSKEDMSAVGSYDEFMRQYQNIFTQVYGMLKNDSFLVIKVGEIRDKKTGVYRNFVGHNISIMERVGFKYYNELTLISPCGTAQLRAAKGMISRKIIKLHQNVLVFYKGNPKNIKNKFQAIELPDELLEQGDGDEYN
jgi:DNA modification methylase